MGLLTTSQAGGKRSLDLPQPVASAWQRNALWQIAQRMTEAGASAVGLPYGFLATSRAGRQPGPVILPIKTAARRLENARAIAGSTDSRPMVFACTHACETQYLTNDEDSRDRRYLSGTRTIAGLHVYCGGIEASISRALVYAPYADVLSYYCSRLDFDDAERFAAVVSTALPDKQLALGFSATSPALQDRDVNQPNNDKRLRRLGYDYYFFTRQESVVFHSFPQETAWALFDDGIDPADTHSPRESRRWLRFGPSLGSRSLQRCSLQDPQRCR